MGKKPSVGKENLPSIGDEVLYRNDDRWYSAEVVAIHKSGELSLCFSENQECVRIRQRSTHGNHTYGWLTYEEAAANIETSA